MLIRLKNRKAVLQPQYGFSGPWARAEPTQKCVLIIGKEVVDPTEPTQFPLEFRLILAVKLFR